MLKSKLKKTFLNKVNSIIKAKLQARRVHRERKYFLKILGNKKLPEENEIIRLFRKKLIQNHKKLVRKEGKNVRIFFACKITNWESSLLTSLKNFGNVIHYDWREYGFNDDDNKNWLKTRDIMNNHMLKKFYAEENKEHIDIFLGYLSGYNTNSQTLDAISKSGTIIFNFCWDDDLSFRGKYLLNRFTGPYPLVKSIDLNLTNSKDSLLKYFACDSLALFWPEAANDEIFKPVISDFEYDVSFIGKKYGFRSDFIHKLKKAKIDVKCFGEGWENGPVTEKEMIEIISKSRINLGFSSIGHTNEIMHLKARDFEIPLAGGLYLTQDFQLLNTVYDIGIEIVTYKNISDCIEKIKWILNNKNIAEQIRNNGRRRALLEHTWTNRLNRLLEISIDLD